MRQKGYTVMVTGTEDNFSEITGCKDNLVRFHIRNTLRMHVLTEMLYIYTNITYVYIESK